MINYYPLKHRPLSATGLLALSVSVYLLAGTLLQVKACVVHTGGLPCAGWMWTPIIIFLWPFFGAFDLTAGWWWSGGLEVLVFAIIVTLMIMAIRRKK